MHTGTQIIAPAGLDTLRHGVKYHFLRNDEKTQRVIVVEFCNQEKPNARKKRTPVSVEQNSTPSNSSCSRNRMKPRPVLHYLSRVRFEHAVDVGLIVVSEEQDELPKWLAGLNIQALQAHDAKRVREKISHADRIDAILAHLWPLVQNVDQVLTAEVPDAVINAHARACLPRQNETRLRIAFYAYICFGLCRWALHYAVQNIGRWSRLGLDKKFGRPSHLNGAYHGYGSCDVEMIGKILEGYRKFSGPGQHMSKIYRRTMHSVFGCITQTGPDGRKYYVHPAGKPFPTLGQFVYRVSEEYPLEARQIYKYGSSRVRTRLTHSQGRYAESVGNLMERTEQDAYCCDVVVKGYLPNSHLPPLWVAKNMCVTSRMQIGIGFSVGGEAASAYRMALFCAAIDKVKFCSLFGLTIRAEDWPSIGVSPHVINDRGPGSTAKADAAIASVNATIKEAAPSNAGQSKASIETSHPKSVKLEGKPQFRETRQSIPQLAIQEILRTIADNNSIDVSSRLNNDALVAGVLPTPVQLWSYLDKRGRNNAVHMRFDEAVRAYLTPIEVTVQDDAVYFKAQRFNSVALGDSGLLQKSHDCGNFKIRAYMLDACVRHLWVDYDNELIEVDATLAIRDGEENLYISVIELEQLQKIRGNAKTIMRMHSLAARSEFEAQHEAHTGMPFEQEVRKGGRNKRGKSDSLEERREIIGYLRASGGRK